MSSSSCNEEYYKALGLPELSTRAEIKRAYNVKIVKAHPDKRPPKEKKAAEKEAIILNEAKENILKDLDLREDTFFRSTNYLFVGNPGSGKSTLLNGLIKKLIFQSGVSFGTGMTAQLATHLEGGDTYMDTPGLADAARREEAAQAITKAMRSGGYFKIIFVLTLDSGRLRPADRTTMQLVLDAAPIENFGVIFNRVSQNLIKAMRAHEAVPGEPSPMEKILAQLWSGGQGPATEHVIMNPFDPALDDLPNQVVPLNEVLSHFIESLPTTYIEPPNVREISFSKFEEMEKMFEELRQETAEIKTALAGKEATIERLVQELREARRPLCLLQ